MSAVGHARPSSNPRARALARCASRATRRPLEIGGSRPCRQCGGSERKCSATWHSFRWIRRRRAWPRATHSRADMGGLWARDATKAAAMVASPSTARTAPRCRVGFGPRAVSAPASGCSSPNDAMLEKKRCRRRGPKRSFVHTATRHATNTAGTDPGDRAGTRRHRHAWAQGRHTAARHTPLAAPEPLTRRLIRNES